MARLRKPVKRRKKKPSVQKRTPEPGYIQKGPGGQQQQQQQRQEQQELPEVIDWIRPPPKIDR
jgi:hypothetical protein